MGVVHIRHRWFWWEGEKLWQCDFDVIGIDEKWPGEKGVVCEKKIYREINTKNSAPSVSNQDNSWMFTIHREKGNLT